MLVFVFYDKKILSTFKKAHYVSLFAKLYYLLRLGPPMFKTWLRPCLWKARLEPHGSSGGS